MLKKKEQSTPRRSEKRVSLLLFVQYKKSDERGQEGCEPNDKGILLQSKDKNPIERAVAATGTRHNAKVMPTARPRPAVAKGM